MNRRGSILARLQRGIMSTTALVLLAGSGCGGPALYPVRGTVVWPDGAPARELAGGMVQLDRITDDPKGRISPHGNIREDGTFELSTFKSGDGAPAGTYRVLVVPVVWTEGMLADRPAPLPVLDPRFQSFDTSRIEVTVEAKKNDLSIRVERARGR